MHLHFIGFGYSASFIWKKLQGQGVEFSATYRSQAKADHLQALGITPTNAPKAPTHVLCSAPHFDAPYASWLGYLSSTGVYGDHNGEWVDEESECRASTPRTIARLETEKLWLKKGAQVFRLGGIYGHGRNVLEDAIHSPTRSIDKPGQYFSRIHVEDIAGAVIASMKNPAPLSIYNIVDDHPCSACEVMEEAHRLLKLPPPEIVPFEQAELSPMAREFYMANRRVRNTKLKQQLAYDLLYPSYKEGLHAIYASLALG